jgi:hypothetical protein
MQRAGWTDRAPRHKVMLHMRQCHSLQGLLTEPEAGELAKLQLAMREYVNRIAPLPLEAAKRLHAKLVQKHQATKS